MKAMIFAAGIGSRLGSITQTTPKCLVQINGASMLEIVAERLKTAGVTEIMINIHHFADTVIEFVKSRTNFGVSVSFSREDYLLETGGGLKKVATFFQNDKSFLVHNSDIYCEYPLKELVGIHSKSKNVATLAVMKRETTRGLFFSKSMNLTGWTEEKDPPIEVASSNLFAFSGIQVVSSRIFEFMPKDEKFSIISSYLNAARAGNSIAGVDISGTYWKDIGKPNELESLREYVKKND